MWPSALAQSRQYTPSHTQSAAVAGRQCIGYSQDQHIDRCSGPQHQDQDSDSRHGSVGREGGPRTITAIHAVSYTVYSGGGKTVYMLLSGPTHRPRPVQWPSTKIRTVTSDLRDLDLDRVDLSMIQKGSKEPARTLKQTRNHVRGSAIPAGPLSDFDEILCRWWISKTVLLSKISTL